MSINQLHRRNIIAWYCIIFYALMLFKWWSGLLLYQIQPALFNTRFDVFTWGFMQTGIHQRLMMHKAGWYILDGLFYSLPAFYWVADKKLKRLTVMVAVLMLLVNWLYIQCYTLYPSSSIESFMAWLLFPVLFITTRLRSFFYVLHCLRFFFLFLLTSAGLWKVVQMGVFNREQMSGVLLYQHKEFLTSSPGYWLSTKFYYLVNHPRVSFLLYLVATLVELSFFIGFFTKKYDRFLLAFFILFLLSDLFLMRIYYWELIPFVLTLLYSKFKRPSALRY